MKSLAYAVIAAFALQSTTAFGKEVETDYPAIIVSEGDCVPVSGLFLPKSVALSLSNEVVTLREENKTLKAGVPVWVVVTLTVVAAAAGATGGYLLSKGK